MKRALNAIASMFGLATPTPGEEATPEAAFWAWFVENEDQLFAIDPDRDRATMLHLFGELNLRLEQIDPGLAFEFGGRPKDGKREFVISAEGVRDLIPVVQRVHNAAPDLARWTFTAFRPRSGANDIVWNQERVAHTAVLVAIGVSERVGKLDLIVFLPGVADRAELDSTTIMYLLLDRALGEFDVMTKVGYIELATLEDARVHDAIPLAELPAIFDVLHAGLQEHLGQNGARDN